MPSPVSLGILQLIKIAAPCTADWDSMSGDDRARHCSQCNLKVYNLSAMSADEAAALVQGAEGRLCVRLYQRADGTVITQDCPVGLRLLRIRTVRALRRIAAAVALLVSGGLTFGLGSRDSRSPRLASMEPFSTLREWLSPTPPQVISPGRMLMGDVCIAPRPSVQPGGKP